MLLTKVYVARESFIVMTTHCVVSFASTAGGTAMKSMTDPPPPPLAADVRLSALQCRTAAENLCVAASQLLSLIRTLRLSLLLMDQDTLRAEEELQIHESKIRTTAALQQALQLEQELMQLRQQSLGGGND